MVQNTPCMLLHEKCGEGRPPVPHALISSLQRKKLALSHCHCPWDAMARVMVRQRDVTQGREQDAMILLIVEPERIPHAWDLAEAALRYAPFVICWIFEAEHTPRLRPYEPVPSAAREAVATKIVEPDAEPKPVRTREREPRLVVSGPAEERDSGRGRDGEGESSLQLVARLVRLLTGEPPEAARPRHGRGGP
ncbi:MAG: hypothetical protein KDA21_06060 [Phycisphaerales bacterium]|nr:hypothetical protein [Phycisphaerales bacterium]